MFSSATEPSWILTNLEGTRATSSLADVDEIDVIRMEYEAMRTVPTESAQIVYDGSRYASSYASRDWLRILASTRASFVLRRVASPLRVLSAWALLVAAAHLMMGPKGGIVLISLYLEWGVGVAGNSHLLVSCFPTFFLYFSLNNHSNQQ